MADHPLAPGAAERQRLIDGGFTSTEADTWQQQQSGQLLGAGFTPKEVDDYFGTPGPLDTGPMAATINGHLDNVGVDDHARVASSPLDYFQAGLQHSSTGLLSGKPNVAAPPDAGFAQKLLEQVGGMVGDIPAMAVGIVTGTALGGAAGTAALPGPGTAVGALAGAGAGAASLPAAIREVMTGYYNHPDGPKDWPSFLSEFATTQWDIAKAAVTGGTAAVAGGAAGEVTTGVAAPLVGAVGGKLVGGAANAVTFAGAATATNAALSGQVPSAEDFLAGAILALGFTVAGSVVGAGNRFVPSERGQQVADNLQKIYNKTGIPPREIVQAARGDVVLQGEILGPTRADGTSATPTLDSIKPQEPAPSFPRQPEVTATNVGKTLTPETMFKPSPEAPEQSAAQYLTPKAQHGSADIQGMRPELQDRLAALISNAPPEMQPYLRVISGARDSAEQATLWQAALKKYGSPEEARKWVAPPGTSLHEQGAAADIGWKDGGLGDAPPAVIKYLHDNAAAYKLKFPLSNESWHVELEETRGGALPPQAKSGTVSLPPTPEQMPGILNTFRQLEGSRDDEVSTAGAIGRYQITPDTARTYGFDPARLKDPAYNETAAKAILADLYKRYNGDMAAVAVAYNAGPGRADIWLRSGRNMGMLPRETQLYLQHLDALGAGTGEATRFAGDGQLRAQGDDGSWEPPGGPPPPREGIVEPPDGSGRKVTTDRLGLTDEDLLNQAMLDKIAPKQSGLIPDYMKPRELFSQFDFQLSPARALDKTLGSDKSQLTVEDMMRQTLGSAGRAAYFVRFGTLDPASLEQTSSANFIRAFEEVKKNGGTTDGFMAYRLAARTVEKAEQGIDTGFPLDKAKALLAKKGVRAKYEKAAGIIRDVKDASIDYAVGSGRFSEEFGERLKELNREHIVMRRSLEPGYRPPTVGGRVFGGRANLKKMEGSDLPVVDPLGADVDNLHTIIAMADYNRAIGDILGRAEAQNEFLKQQNPPPPPAKEQLFDENGKPLPPEANDAAQELIATRKAYGTLGQNDFIYYRDGKMEVWQAKDPDLARMLRLSWPGKVNPFAMVAIKTAGLVRSGVAMSLDFPARTTVRSLIAGSALAEGSRINPLHNFMHGIMDVFNRGDLYRDWVANGGAGTAITDLDVNVVQKEVNSIFEKTGTGTALWNVVRHPIDAMRTLQHMLDAAPRVGMFGDLRDGGMDPKKAAMLSRTGYIDFGEGFANPWMQTYSRMTAYMLSGYKDLAQVAEATARDPKRLALYGATLMTVPTIVNYVANMIADQSLPDGQKYGDLPRWMRDQYLVTPPIFGTRLKLPLRPYVVAVPFALLPERFMDWAATHDPHFSDWVGDMGTMIVPPWLPNIALPVIENWANKSTNTDQPLVPASLEADSGYMQYKADTSETAKAITKLIGPASMNIADVSPIVLDNYIREWGGTMPTALLHIFETPIKDPGRPKSPADLPFLGSFFVRNPVGGQQVDDFYSKYDAVTKAHADLKVAIERQDFSEIKDATKVQAVVKMSAVTTALSNMRKAVNAINLDKEMTDNEKLKRTDQISAGMVATAKAGSAILDSLSRGP